MSNSYIIVEGNDSILLVPAHGKPDHVTRAELAESLQPLAVLGYDVPDVTALPIAEIALRLAGRFVDPIERDSQLGQKVLALQAEALKSGSVLRVCLSVPESTANLILRRGRDSIESIDN